jgi:hypothetical protein
VTVTEEARPAEVSSGGWVAALYRRRSWLWLVPAVPAVVLVLLVMVVMPPEQTLENVGDWAFRLSPFVLAVIAVSLLPKGRFGPALIVIGVVVYMGYLDTGMVLRILDLANAPDEEQQAVFEHVYQFELFVATFIVLFGLFAYRMAGARTVSVLKVGAASILVVVSGLNDLTFWLTNDWGADGRPAVLRWASHIIVFVGGPPSVVTAWVFLAVHLVLAGLVLALPLGRMVDRALARGGELS